jgi:hypothetical protein
MTAALQRAFDEAATLPEPEQELLASWLLAELAVLQTPKLKTAADSFRQGWKEALSGETLPIEHLWEGIDVE